MTPTHIVVDAGGIVVIPIDDATRIRNREYINKGAPPTRFEVQDHYKVGEQVIVGLKDGTAGLIRPPHG